ncbi:MAG TPA: 2-dehydropantoate 2-reductase [Pseudolabrys sp.]|jgi:2-dehydropantoate 2-reductase
MTKKIAVLGSGANGASIGADLTRAGHDVVLIDQWPEHVAAMRERGIEIRMPEETQITKVRAYNLCDICTFTHQFDVVLLLMKAYDSRWACQLIEPYLKPDGLIAGVQNGMTADVIAEVVGPQRTMGCVIEISSTMFDPGVVQRDSPPSRSWFAVGGIDPRTKGREAEVGDLLKCAGTVEYVDDIRARKWMKLVSNATTLVTTAILGQSIHDAATTPAMREVMLRSGQEAFDTGQAMGLPAVPIFGMKPEDVRQSNRLVETLLDTLVSGFTLKSTITTVLQDWMKGRHSEVDNINGEVVTQAHRLGLKMPVNAAIVEVARRVEQGILKPGSSNLQLVLDMAGGK